MITSCVIIYNGAELYYGGMYLLSSPLGLVKCDRAALAGLTSN